MSKQETQTLKQLAQHYGWKLFPLLLLIIVIAPFRGIAFSLSWLLFFINQGLVKFLEVTDV